MHERECRKPKELAQWKKPEVKEMFLTSRPVLAKKRKPGGIAVERRQQMR